MTYSYRHLGKSFKVDYCVKLFGQIINIISRKSRMMFRIELIDVSHFIAVFWSANYCAVEIKFAQIVRRNSIPHTESGKIQVVFKENGHCFLNYIPYICPDCVSIFGDRAINNCSDLLKLRL